MRNQKSFDDDYITSIPMNFAIMALDYVMLPWRMLAAEATVLFFIIIFALY